MTVSGRGQDFQSGGGGALWKLILMIAEESGLGISIQPLRCQCMARSKWLEGPSMDVTHVMSTLVSHQLNLSFNKGEGGTSFLPKVLGFLRVLRFFSLCVIFIKAFPQPR